MPKLSFSSTPSPIDDPLTVPFVPFPSEDDSDDETKTETTPLSPHRLPSLQTAPPNSPTFPPSPTDGELIPIKKPVVPTMSVERSWERIHELLTGGYNVTSDFPSTEQKNFYLDGDEHPTISAFDGSSVFDFKRKTVKKSTTPVPSSVFSVKINFGEDENGNPCVIDARAKSTTRIISEIEGILPLMNSQSSEHMVVVEMIIEGGVAQDIHIYAQHVEVDVPKPFVHYVITSDGEKWVSWNEKNL
ncbi:hypothetical protein TrLO_g7250 [Triparma laevis f. longispina]|uniref:Uncharacterized protein n=1 Tax=Triparma laevis f. longispina TaxID=1714387 RepID=A0A9W7C731_9STRA|nr:hypothetical protein TrLO_g7250 [Triparma laevis f. longispina]